MHWQSPCRSTVDRAEQDTDLKRHCVEGVAKMSQAQVDAYSAVMKAMYAQGLTQVTPRLPLRTCSQTPELRVRA